MYENTIFEPIYGNSDLGSIAVAIFVGVYRFVAIASRTFQILAVAIFVYIPAEFISSRVYLWHQVIAVSRFGYGMGYIGIA